MRCCDGGCATSHYWGREIGKLGLEARLIPPVYVTPFVKRQKNGAEAIAGAALRPTMRYVSVKSAAQQAQAAGIVFRTRNLFVRQRSQLVNALRGHLAEYGVVVAQGRVQFRRLMVNFDETAPDLPEPDLPAPNLPAPVQGLRWFMNCAACTLSRYSFLMKRSGVSIKRYNTGQRQMRAHRVS